MGRKRLENIRKVQLNGYDYFVYDMGADRLGKRRRLYGKSEQELRNKIKLAEQEKELLLKVSLPAGDDLKSWLCFFLKSCIGRYSIPNIKRWTKLCENVLFDKFPNRKIKDISAEEIVCFFKDAEPYYPKENLEDLEKIMRDTFSLAKDYGRCDFKFPEIVIQNRKTVSGERYYLTDTELQILLQFCLLDRCQSYSKKELIITLSLMTGIRCSDILSLSSKDIDLERKIITTQGRKVPISGTTAEWLDDLSRRGLIDLNAEMIFCFTAKPYSLANIQHTLRLICNRCGLPKGVTTLTIHKSYVVREFNRGVPAAILALRYGYSVQAVNDMVDEAESLFRLKRLS